jgi:hypothetical protein
MPKVYFVMNPWILTFEVQFTLVFEKITHTSSDHLKLAKSSRIDLAGTSGFDTSSTTLEDASGMLRESTATFATMSRETEPSNRVSC